MLKDSRDINRGNHLPCKVAAIVVPLFVFPVLFVRRVFSVIIASWNPPRARDSCGPFRSHWAAVFHLFGPIPIQCLPGCQRRKISFQLASSRRPNSIPSALILVSESRTPYHCCEYPQLHVLIIFFFVR